MREGIIELLRECATDLPADVESALVAAYKKESGTAKDVLCTILENVRIAREKSAPMCQDTGTPIVYVTTPPKADRIRIRREIIAALRKATSSVPLRANAVDPVTGANTGDNTGEGFPAVHFREWKKKRVRFELLLKGGGSENVTRLYTLPEKSLNAGRDLEGVERCVLDAVYKAQGKACPPYFIGVGIGGLADATINLSKRQLLRKVGDINKDSVLARFEADAVKKINALGIGPMGLGGKVTALSCKVGKQHRNPPSYFVAVSFNCWALRRRTVEVSL